MNAVAASGDAARRRLARVGEGGGRYALAQAGQARAQAAPGREGRVPGAAAAPGQHHARWHKATPEERDQFKQKRAQPQVSGPPLKRAKRTVVRGAGKSPRAKRGLGDALDDEGDDEGG